MDNIRHKNNDVRYEVFLCLTVMSASFLFCFEKNYCLFLSLCVLSFFKYIQIRQTCLLILRLADCTGRNITSYLWKWVVSQHRKNINVYWFFLPVQFLLLLLLLFFFFFFFLAVTVQTEKVDLCAAPFVEQLLS